MDTEALSNLSRMLEGGDDFLLLTHMNPDGDAIGSVFGMSRLLRENGKRATVFLHEPLPEQYAPFEDGPTITGDPPDFNEFATIVCLDFSAPGRFKEGIPFHDLPSINIDHHVDNQNFCADNFVFPEAAATADIVFHAALNARWRVS